MGLIDRDYEEISRRVSAAASGASILEDKMRLTTDELWRLLADRRVAWLGFYVINDPRDAMTLVCCRPRPACSPIGLHGVCGKAWREKKAQVVEDVYSLGDNHIVCDPSNLSEVVVPCLGPDGECWGVLDLDSQEKGAFTKTDAEGLAKVLRAAGLSVIDKHLD